MIPTRGWRDREARAKERNQRKSLNPEVSAELARIMHEREVAIEAERAAERAANPAPKGPVTAAQMIQNTVVETPAAPADVTPDEDAVAEIAPEAETEAAPEVSADPKPKTARKKS